MALTNPNNPNGFRPLMVSISGGVCGVGQYSKPSSDSNAIYTWDVVSKTNTSAVVDGEFLPCPGVKTFAAGTPGTTLIQGVSLNAGAASQATWHAVMDDPTAVFVAQTDSTTTGITVATDVGYLANVNNTAQTNGTTISAMTINASTLATTGTLDLRIRDAYRAITNYEAANMQLEVIINKHQFAPSATGV